MELIIINECIYPSDKNSRDEKEKTNHVRSLGDPSLSVVISTTARCRGTEDFSLPTGNGESFSAGGDGGVKDETKGLVALVCVVLGPGVVVVVPPDFLGLRGREGGLGVVGTCVDLAPSVRLLSTSMGVSPSSLLSPLNAGFDEVDADFEWRARLGLRVVAGSSTIILLDEDRVDPSTED